MLTGNPDVCDALNKKSVEAKSRLAMFGFPTECPVPEGRRCFDGDKKLNVTKYKNLLNIASGKMEIDAEIEHDTVCPLTFIIIIFPYDSRLQLLLIFILQGKSCLKMRFELYK